MPDVARGWTTTKLPDGLLGRLANHVRRNSEQCGTRKTDVRKRSDAERSADAEETTPRTRPLRAGPGSDGKTPRSSQLDNEIIFCARTTPTRPPQPFNSSPRRAKPTRPSDRNAPIPFEFEPVRTAEDARNALTAVIGAMAAGEITGAEAAEAMRPIRLFLETLVVEMRKIALQRW
jgi:hypothetical protein